MFAMEEHIVKFSNLKDGQHLLSYALGKDFFTELGNEDLPNGTLNAKVELDKSTSMLIAQIELEGQLDLNCDRCNDPMNYPVNGTLRQIFRIGTREQFDQDEITGLDPNAHEINLSHYLYECLRLALPLRRVHAPDACDPAVLAVLESAYKAPEDVVDPRWEALRRSASKPA